MTSTPIAEGLFDLEGSPALLGGRCNDCDALSFPAAPGCPRCSSADVVPVRLGTRGTLWTWTSQEFRPVSPPYAGPEEFSRYYVGYVELPGEIRVEAHLTGIEGREPRIGEEMELEIVPFRTDEDGHEVLTYAFAPARAAEGEQP